MSARTPPPDRRAGADNGAGSWKKYHLWIGVAVSGALIAVCYNFALQLPFFFDDLPVVTWLGRHTWGRRLIWSALGGAIVLQNVFFLNHQRSLFTTLNRVYQQVLDAAEEEQIDHRSVWLTVYQDEQFLLKLASAVTPAAALTAEPLVRFEGGPIVESAIVKQHRRDEWAVTLTLPGGSGPYTVQVGVYNAGGRLPAYADGVRALDDAASVVTIQP